MNDSALDKFLYLLLRDRNIMCVFLILSMKSEKEGKVIIPGFWCGGLPQQNRMMCVDHVQLQLRNQLIDECRDRQRSGNIDAYRQAQTWIAKDKWLAILIIIFLRKDKYVMSQRGECIAKDLEPNDKPVHLRQVKICKISNVHGLTLGVRMD